VSEASQELTERIRALIGHKPGVTEKRMFGGAGFMLFGNMVAGAMSSGALLMRVGPDNHEAAKTRPGAHAMHQGGKEMKGFIEVTDEGIEDDEALKDWIDYAWAFVKTLPPK
jgi:TfoX/Sxy family transcriptional regulator of competence genes